MKNKFHLIVALMIIALFFMGAFWTTKIYKTDGGDKMVVASGGEIEIASGGTLDIKGNVSFTGATITATEQITSTHIANIDREKELSLSDFFISDETTLSLLTATPSASDPYLKLDATGGPTIVFPPGCAKYLIQRVRVPLDLNTGATALGDWGFRFTLARSDRIATSLAYSIWAEGELAAPDTGPTEYTLNQANDGLASSPREQVASSPRESIAGVKWLVLKYKRSDSSYGVLEVRRVIAFFNRVQ